MRWAQIEPILSLFLNQDEECDSVFVPVERVQGIDKELLANLARNTDAVPSADIVARILDLAWVLRVGTPSSATLAVDNYLLAAAEYLDVNNWIHSWYRYDRAMNLSLSIGKKNEKHLAVARSLEEVIDKIHAEDKLWLTARLLRLLRKHKLGDYRKYAELSHGLATKARETYELDPGSSISYDRERAFLEIEIDWLRLGDDKARINELKGEIAVAFVRQADGVIKAGGPSAKLMAIQFLGDAIAELRKATGQRDYVEQLRLKQETLRREAVKEMTRIDVSRNITAEVERMVAHVSRADPLDAVSALATFYHPPEVSEIREEKNRLDSRYLSRVLFPAEYLGARGATLAKHVMVSKDGSGAFDNEKIELIRLAYQQQCEIAPFLCIAAQKIYEIHALDSSWFSAVSMLSDLVPEGRIRTFARGLAAGLRGDYELSTALLLPQFEHAVRELFFARNVVTTTLPTDGIQNEISLNSLLEHSAALDILGEAAVFDLRALLTEKAGGNLRNEFAHGLIDEDGKWGSKVYFWWICLRLVFGRLYLPGNDERLKRAIFPNMESANDK